MQHVMQAHPTMASRWRELIERLLSWYDPVQAAARNRRTEAIRQHSIKQRMLAEQRLANYQRARFPR